MQEENEVLQIRSYYASPIAWIFWFRFLMRLHHQQSDFRGLRLAMPFYLIKAELDMYFFVWCFRARVLDKGGKKEA
jgi:hypothetical protein